jgi:hypothetical protein
MSEIPLYLDRRFSKNILVPTGGLVGLAENGGRVVQRSQSAPAPNLKERERLEDQSTGAWGLSPF